MIHGRSGSNGLGSSGRGEKTKLAVWSAGILAVFLVHVGALVLATGGEGSARIWSILLLIFAPLTVVGLIGGGIARAIRNDSNHRHPPSNEEER